MNCEQVRLLLHAYLDGELDLMRSLEIEEHLQGCPGCTRQLEEIRLLRSSLKEAVLYRPAPADLRKRIRSSIDKLDKAPFAWSFTRFGWFSAAALLAIVVLLGFGLAAWFGIPAQRTDSLVAEIEAAHIRSLMVGHLTDVASSDQHTVKPWFDGKLDFSPPVVDLANQGYPLVGGRLDYLGGRPVAALIYRRNKHYINLFIWPSPGGSQALQSRTDNGYHIDHWSQSGMNYWAVSDLNIPEFQKFIELVQQNFK